MYNLSMGPTLAMVLPQSDILIIKTLPSLSKIKPYKMITCGGIYLIFLPVGWPVWATV